MKTAKKVKVESVNLKGGVDSKNLRNDDVFPKSKVVAMKELTGIESRRGLEKGVISNNKLVNVVSDTYGHLDNANFFGEMERKLISEDINYATRSINRDDRAFSVDYILNDDRYIVKVKNNGGDKLRPMLHLVNSYDGTCKTTGSFGFFREVCSNGLHVAHTQIGFQIFHRGDMQELVMPEIKDLVSKFIKNEFYQLSKKFEVMAERALPNVEQFVKVTAEHFNLFTFEKSEKNDLPSVNAQQVIDTINREAKLLNVQPNAWLGYNAFNELLHGKLKKTFPRQSQLDNALFEQIASQAGA